MPRVELEQNAAQEQVDTFVIDGDDQTQEQESNIAPTTESAPVENESQSTEAEKPTDNFQARINKVTADKYAEKRRADELERRIKELESKPKAEVKKPTLEAHDYDEEAYNSANVSYQVQQELAKEREAQNSQTRQAQEQREMNEFNERINKLGKEDFADKANAVPVLPEGVADALVQSENGAELIYHLGEHLDVADSIANMTPARAMMELGRISANMSVTKKIKTSAAPDPIETLNSSGAISKERGPANATYS